MPTPADKPKRKIFLVDDHPLVREWLTNLISQQPDLVVVGEASGDIQALEGIAATKAEAAILDLALRGSSGIELIKQLKNSFPKLVMLVLSMHEESLYAPRALQAGARGYVMKNESAQRIIEALRLVLQGRVYVSDSTTHSVLTQFAEGKALTPKLAIEQLSDRELRVFEQLGQGLTTRQIAEQMHLSIKTIQAHCVNIKNKLSLKTSTDLLREALRYQDEKILKR